MHSLFHRRSFIWGSRWIIKTWIMRLKICFLWKCRTIILPLLRHVIWHLKYNKTKKILMLIQHNAWKKIFKGEFGVMVLLCRPSERVSSWHLHPDDSYRAVDLSMCCPQDTQRGDWFPHNSFSLRHCLAAAGLVTLKPCLSSTVPCHWLHQAHAGRSCLSS